MLRRWRCRVDKPLLYSAWATGRYLQEFSFIVMKERIVLNSAWIDCWSRSTRWFPGWISSSVTVLVVEDDGMIKPFVCNRFQTLVFVCLFSYRTQWEPNERVCPFLFFFVWACHLYTHNLPVLVLMCNKLLGVSQIFWLSFCQISLCTMLYSELFDGAIYNWCNSYYYHCFKTKFGFGVD